MTAEDSIFLLFFIGSVITIGVGMWYGDRQPPNRRK